MNDTNKSSQNISTSEYKNSLICPKCFKSDVKLYGFSKDVVSKPYYIYLHCSCTKNCIIQYELSSYINNILNNDNDPNLRCEHQIENNEFYCESCNYKMCQQCQKYHTLNYPTHKCNLINDTQNFLSYCKIHKAHHTYYCKDCKKGYSTYLVQDEPHLECVYCSSHNTVRAGKTKHGVQIYKCNDCGRRFNEDKTKLDFDTLCPHCGGVIAYKGWSNDGTVRRYVCKSCRRTFSGDVNHLNIKEKVVEKPCPYCGSHNIRKGGRLKSGLKRYKCNDCGKGYNEGTVVITPKYRPEKCPHCGGTHINCSGHDTKTGKQRYKCIDCGKKFVENPTQHNFKVWEHECPKCGHKRARKAGRTQGKQYYQCLQCGHKDLEGGKYKHLSAKDVTKLRELYRTGIPLKYIASEMNRSQNSIRTLIKDIRTNIIDII